MMENLSGHLRAVAATLNDAVVLTEDEINTMNAAADEIERLRAVLQNIASLELTKGAAANAAQDALRMR